MLKARWRSVFFKPPEIHHTFVPSVITACAVLHNICLMEGDIFEPVEDVRDTSGEGVTKGTWPMRSIGRAPLCSMCVPSGNTEP